MRSFLLMIIFFSGLMGACVKNDEHREIQFREISFRQIPSDIKIPAQAWDLLSKPGKGTEGVCLGCLVANREVMFSEINVLLIGKNPGIVSGEAVRISLPKGGGTIDLANFITDKRGSFYVKFEYGPFEKAFEKTVIFVSGSQKRKIGDRYFGSGCNQFFDISNRFVKDMSGDGLKVNTTEDRHLSVLGGTFLFAAKRETVNDVAQVTFTHSKKRPLLCSHGEQ
jgi:hypothetical protein